MNVIRAAIVGDEKTVKQWLTAPHTTHPGQEAQVLDRAAKHGHDNICQLMLESGRVSYIATVVALTTACRHNQQSTAQLLMQHGHVDKSNLNDALLAACVRGRMRIVTWLLSDVMQLSQSDRIKWLLTTACASGDMSVVKQLVTQVDTDVKRVMSQAFRVACYNGRDDVVKWLMSHMAVDVNSRDVILVIDGEVTSLMVACDTSNYDIVRRLLQSVTPHTVNMMSGRVENTALHFAICCETMKNCPMQAGCIDSDIAAVTATLYLSNLDLQISGDKTALHYACTRGDVEIVRMLLSVFADTDITDDQRRTPAMMAKLNGHTELLLYLRCTLSDPTDIPMLVSNTNNSVSITVLSIEDATQHNTSNTNSK